jgi:hypothetical protein
MKVARILMRLGNKQAGKEIGLFNVIFKVITPEKVATVVALMMKDEANGGLVRNF